MLVLPWAVSAEIARLSSRRPIAVELADLADHRGVGVEADNAEAVGVGEQLGEPGRAPANLVDRHAAHRRRGIDREHRREVRTLTRSERSATSMRIRTSWVTRSPGARLACRERDLQLERKRCHPKGIALQRLFATRG